MLRRLAPMLMILVCVTLDTTVIPVAYGGVYTVPLTVVAVFLIGMLMGRMSGLLYGTIGGLLIDITTGTLGMMTFFFMAVGFMIGLILYNPGERLRTARQYRHTIADLCRPDAAAAPGGLRHTGGQQPSRPHPP